MSLILTLILLGLVAIGFRMLPVKFLAIAIRW